MTITFVEYLIGMGKSIGEFDEGEASDSSDPPESVEGVA